MYDFQSHLPLKETAAAATMDIEPRGDEEVDDDDAPSETDTPAPQAAAFTPLEVPSDKAAEQQVAKDAPHRHSIRSRYVSAQEVMIDSMIIDSSRLNIFSPVILDFSFFLFSFFSHASSIFHFFFLPPCGA